MQVRRLSLAVRLNRLFQKKWFLALFLAMIIALIIETSLIVFFLVVSSLGRQSLPSIALAYHLRPGCSTLTATMISQTSDNQTFQYSCSGRAALYMPPSGWGGPADCCGADSILVSPSFTLPASYLRLSVVNTDYDCSSRNEMRLVNGGNMTLGGASSNGGGVSYNYCAVVAGQSGRIQGFTITWNPVPWPGLCCTMSASPTQLTIPEGQNASTRITVTAVKSFFGNVSFSLVYEDGSSRASPSASIIPTNVIVRPDSSNATIVTVITYKGSGPGTLTLVVYSYPNRYYSGTTVNVAISIT